jgi:hypothetical protein
LVGPEIFISGFPPLSLALANTRRILFDNSTHSRPGFKRQRLLSLIDVFAACAQPEELEDAFVPGLDLAVIKLAMQLHGGALRHCCISQQATLSPWAASSASIKELPSARLQMSRSGSLLS